MILSGKMKKAQGILMCLVDRKLSNETEVNELVLVTPDYQNILTSRITELGGSNSTPAYCNVHANPLWSF